MRQLTFHLLPRSSALTVQLESDEATALEYAWASSEGTFESLL
jgi:hypothetical protein